jgi:hypothetical protein
VDSLELALAQGSALEDSLEHSLDYSWDYSLVSLSGHELALSAPAAYSKCDHRRRRRSPLELGRN